MDAITSGGSASPARNSWGLRRVDTAEVLPAAIDQGDTRDRRRLERAAVAATMAPRPCPAMTAGGPSASTPAPLAARTVSASQARDSRSRPGPGTLGEAVATHVERQDPELAMESSRDGRPAPARGRDAVEQQQGRAGHGGVPQSR